MTTKELLYVDDALAHAQLLATQFENAANQLQDASLRRCGRWPKSTARSTGSFTILCEVKDNG